MIQLLMVKRMMLVRGQRVVAAGLLALLLSLSHSATLQAHEITLEQSINWVVQRLSAELEGGADLNIISSLSYPLTSTPAIAQRPKVRELLERIGRYIAAMEQGKLGCGERSDLLLLRGFLHTAGVGRPTDKVEGLAGCEIRGNRFATVNALIYQCRYGAGPGTEQAKGLLKVVESYQLQNGAFMTEQGRQWYYLTSHGALALHYCGSSAERTARAQQRLLEQLPGFYRSGFNDGLTESLIFLRWMGVAVEDEQRYLAALHARINNDGGLCFSEQPNCHSHWHASSLLLELLAGD